MAVLEFLSHKPKPAVIIAGAAGVLLVGGADYLTGHAVSPSLFYLLPVFYVTWFAGRRAGIGIAFLSASTLLAVELQMHRLHPIVSCLNFAARSGVFLTFVLLLSAVKRKHEDLEKEVADKTASLRESLEEHLRVEGELRESEERFHATFDQAPVGIAHLDLQGKWLRINRKLCEIVGYTEEELRHLTFEDITHPDDLDASLRYAGQLTCGEVPNYSLEKRYCRKDGSHVWVNLSASMVSSSAGDRRYVVDVIEDITLRKRAEEKIVRQRGFLEKIIESIAHPFYVIDADDFTINLANSASGMRAGRGENTCYALTHGQDRPCSQSGSVCPVELAKESKKLVTVEHTHSDAGGEAKSFEVHASPLFDADGNVTQVIV